MRAHTICYCLGYSWLFVSDMPPKSIHRERPGQSHSWTKQKLNKIYRCSYCYATVKIQMFFANSGTFHGLLVCGLAASHPQERCWVMANSSARFLSWAHGTADPYSIKGTTVWSMDVKEHFDFEGGITVKMVGRLSLVVLFVLQREKLSMPMYRWEKYP